MTTHNDPYQQAVHQRRIAVGLDCRFCTAAHLPDPTSNQLGPWHAGDPGTSRAAALNNYPRSGTQRARVLSAIAAAGDHGATDYELGQALDLKVWVAGTRRGELMRDGWVHATPTTRPTDSGNAATVWTLTPAARAKLTP